MIMHKIREHRIIKVPKFWNSIVYSKFIVNTIMEAGGDVLLHVKSNNSMEDRVRLVYRNGYVCYDFLITNETTLTKSCFIDHTGRYTPTNKQQKVDYSELYDSLSSMLNYDNKIGLVITQIEIL